MVKNFFSHRARLKRYFSQGAATRPRQKTVCYACFADRHSDGPAGRETQRRPKGVNDDGRAASKDQPGKGVKASGHGLCGTCPHGQVWGQCRPTAARQVQGLTGGDFIACAISVGSDRRESVVKAGAENPTRRKGRALREW